MNGRTTIENMLRMAEGMTAVVSPAGEGRVTVAVTGEHGVRKSFAATVYADREDAEAAAAARGAVFADLPALVAGTNLGGFEDDAFDVAPMVYALWRQGADRIVGELCSEAHDGSWPHCGVALVLPFCRAQDPSIDVEAVLADGAVTAGTTREEFTGWIVSLAESPDPEVAEFGASLSRLFPYMKDRDVEGNYIGEGDDPFPEGADDDVLAGMQPQGGRP